MAWIRTAENDNHAWENVNVRLLSLFRPSNLILFKAIRNRSSYFDCSAQSTHENVSDTMKMQLQTSWGGRKERTRKKVITDLTSEIHVIEEWFGYSFPPQWSVTFRFLQEILNSYFLLWFALMAIMIASEISIIICLVLLKNKGNIFWYFQVRFKNMEKEATIAFAFKREIRFHT